MSDYILNKNHLSFWLRQIRKEMRLIAPWKTRAGDIVYKEVENIHEIELNCPALLPTVKEYFFPQKETLLAFDGITVKDVPDAPKTAIFGLRSCDVSALTIVDGFFGGNPIDSYYTMKRANTLLISIGCGRPDPTCFCSGLGAGPFLKEGFDVQLVDLGDRYYVETYSERAGNIMRKFAYLFGSPEKADADDRYEVVHVAETYFEKRLHLERVREAIVSDVVGDEFWRSVTNRCFECGGCVYECPLCTCFNVMDRNYNRGIERIRVWDTCFFKGFTRLAGGVLPNEDRINRTKRWYYHKIVYSPVQLGNFGCVGCGRCTIACPGGIDMATVGLKIGKGLSDEVSIT